MISVSELTGKVYREEECVYFRNIHQCAFYVAHNVLPIDMFTDSENKLVMVFERKQHNETIKLWMAAKEKVDETNNGVKEAE